MNIFLEVKPYIINCMGRDFFKLIFSSFKVILNACTFNSTTRERASYSDDQSIYIPQVPGFMLNRYFKLLYKSVNNIAKKYEFLFEVLDMWSVCKMNQKPQIEPLSFLFVSELRHFTMTIYYLLCLSSCWGVKLIFIYVVRKYMYQEF